MHTHNTLGVKYATSDSSGLAWVHTSILCRTFMLVVPYSGKFSRGAKFRIFVDRLASTKKTRKNCRLCYIYSACVRAPRKWKLWKFLRTPSEAIPWNLYLFSSPDHDQQGLREVGKVVVLSDVFAWRLHWRFDGSSLNGPKHLYTHAHTRNGFLSDTGFEDACVYLHSNHSKWKYRYQ